MEVQFEPALQDKLERLARKSGRAAAELVQYAVAGYIDGPSGTIDWSKCPDVESVPGKVSGAWVLRGTRMPISIIFENLEYGSSMDEIIENYNLTREQIQAVLEFAAQSAAAATPASLTDARPL